MHVMNVAARPDIVFVEGRGSWLIDSTGRQYIDFMQGWAVNTLGHAHPALVTALIRQAGTLINCSPAFHNAPAIELAAMLADLSGLDQVFFTNSGAEANEGAIKLARKWGGRHRSGAFRIVTLDGGFHGRTLATMSASGKPAWNDLFEPKVPGFDKVAPNDIDAVDRAIGPQTAAVMVEPIQGKAGVIPMTHAYLRSLRALTAERGVLLILDEIQTGIGRTGTMFASEHAGIRPDIMTLAKGLGGGVPLGALLASGAASCFEHGDQGGTFNGNPLMTTAGIAVLREVGKPGFLARVTAMGELLASELKGLSARHGFGEIRGRGLLLALDLGAALGPAMVDAARSEGLLVNSPRPNALRFMPALTIDEDDIAAAVARLDRACASVRRGA
jgi:acetylornithine/N-succinyldiaminopimelate aminotransferase